jgi:hypothetical protein
MIITAFVLSAHFKSINGKLGSSPVSSLRVISENSSRLFSLYLIEFLVLYLNQFGKGRFCLLALTSRFFILNDLFAP